ncbi:MAG: electron transport complex subunit RsxC [Prevotellaceae bacterium]|jgi:electron transport complex protein RnfC|nr:electron transport complex subunit RsxC [Prevotellaceae bacterium]
MSNIYHLLSERLPLLRRGLGGGACSFSIGGIHPEDNKLAANSPLQALPPEGTASIFLGQHIGAPAEAIVSKGERVKTGQLIAKASGWVSADIHSSVSGTVVAVEPVADLSGIRQPAITIQVEGDEWLETIDRSPEIIREIPSDSAVIIKKIAAAGIVGLGGAAFPTHVKLSPPPGKKAGILIINAAECEPFLTSDHRVMLEFGEQALIGALLLKQALHASKAFIGIESNKPDAIRELQKIIRERGYELQVVRLKKRYPQGGEKQLIDAVTHRRVPSMGLPADVGVAVQNVGTALAVYEAVQKHKPLIENSITITGKNLPQQINALVRLGTPLSRLAALAGGIPAGTGKIVCGGPMMGKAIVNMDAPTTKVTSALLFIPHGEAQRRKASNCIRCAKCVQACPMGLEPYLLIKLTQRSRYDELRANRMSDCIECGCCLYSCPAHIPLLDYIRMGKGELKSSKLKVENYPTDGHRL